MRKVYSTMPGISIADFPRDFKVSLELSHAVSCFPRQSLAGGGEQVPIIGSHNTVGFSEPGFIHAPLNGDCPHI